MKKIITASIIMMLFTACSTNPVQTVNNTNVSQSSNSVKVSSQITVGKTPHGMGYAQGFIYNSNVGDNTVSVIDTKTDKVIKTIDFEGTPGYIKPFHDQKYIMIADTKLSKIDILDPAQEHKIVQSIKLSSTPDKIVMAEDDKTVFVSLPNEAKIARLVFEEDKTKAPALDYLATGKVLGNEEHRAIDTNNNWVITPDSADNDVTLIDTVKNTTKVLKDGNSPSAVAIGSIDDVARVAVVGNRASNTITLFDIDSDNKATLSDVGLTPTEMAVIPSLRRVFITMAGSNEVAVVDYEGKKLVAKVGVGKRPVHIYAAPATPMGTKAFGLKHDEEENSSEQLWIGNDDGDSVTVLDGRTLEIKATIATDKGHHKMAFSENNKVYVSNINANDVSVIDRTLIK